MIILQFFITKLINVLVSKMTLKKSTFLAKREGDFQCQVNCNSKDFIKQRRLTQLFLIAIPLYTQGTRVQI